MIEFIADRDPWIATTSGERLLFLLLRHHQEWRFLSDSLLSLRLRLARRYENLSNFFVGASILHLMQRMVKLANDVREQRSDDRLEQLSVLRARLCDVLQVTPIEYSADFGELVQEILTSAEKTRSEPSLGLKRRVENEGPSVCYSCGREFDVTPENSSSPLARTADHVWPRALGGDTIADNLLPACEDCNVRKEHLAAWQMAWIQPAVFADGDAASGLQGLRREVRMALHMRAAMAYAHKNGSTLRDAYLAIGPRAEPERIDNEQGYDFFNLRVHDETSTEISWIPS